MPIFQNKILKKYIAFKSEKAETGYQAYFACLYNADIHENIKERVFQQLQIVMHPNFRTNSRNRQHH
jgi:hypothetical protein